jgi:hypothetical protein
VQREIADHPEARAAIEDKCSTCHMPMARYDAAAAGGAGEVLANLAPAAASHVPAMDGVSCTVCHQISEENLGEHASFDGGFLISPASSDGTRNLYGPRAVDAGRATLMHSSATFVPAQATHLQRSEMCATCHTLYTSALDETGQAIAELPEQVPYQEWLHSDYRETHSCQSCHMPIAAADAPIASVLGEPRAGVSQHTFLGANAFVLAVLNKYRGELGTAALSQELDAAVNETRRFLATAAATISIEPPAALDGSVLDFVVAVSSTTGHKLPTAYPSRRAWLHVTVTDAQGRVLFESGAVRPNGAIVGNDNDADAAAFEPHYETITNADQVQVYESVMVDSRGRPTTGLLSGVRYVKDNRVLPRGFDKATADDEVAVHGGALADRDFAAGGDSVRYRVDLGAVPQGPVRVVAELRYQSIGYRWAENLRSYDSAEARRFNRYYDETIAGFALPLASATATVGER